MLNSYNFNNIFATNSQTQDIFPLYNIKINGVLYLRYYSIPKGPSFGGIDLYQLVGRDFSGSWDDASQTLTIVGIL